MSIDTIPQLKNDSDWMRCALAQALHAEEMGEVPVGAILVKDDMVVGSGCNQTISLSDPTSHAEIVAIRAAAKQCGNYRLPGTTLYVTLEPCAMCAGAMVHARISRLVYGAPDARSGAAGSVFNLLNSRYLNHKVEITAGVLADECGEMLRGFFRARR